MCVSLSLAHARRWQGGARKGGGAGNKMGPGQGWANAGAGGGAQTQWASDVAVGRWGEKATDKGTGMWQGRNRANIGADGYNDWERDGDLDVNEPI